MSKFLREDATFSNLTATDLPSLTISGIPSSTQSDALSGIFKTPLNQDYRIWERIGFPITLQRLAARTATGFLTMVVKINTTTVGNFTQGVSTAQFTTTAGSSNTATTGDVLVITVSAVTTPSDFSFTIDFTRALI